MIIVILPSKNESKNISHITRIVDIGLSMYYPELYSLILNVDSASSDGTSNIFISTETVTPKKSLTINKDKIGKGYNIKQGIQYGINHKFKYFLMIDSDVISIQPHWIKRYLKRLIFFDDDLVTPIYQRNKYEGNTTNHFSSPLLYACWGIDIQQPIAGDFAFSEALAKKILDAFEIESDYGYGVDTMITWTALVTSSKITQVSLDKKVHNPSFSKIIDMFSQVCLSTFYRIHKFREIILANIPLASDRPLVLHQNLDLNYCLRPDYDEIETILCFLKNVDEFYCTNTPVNDDIWLDRLSSDVVMLLRNNDLLFDDLVFMSQKTLLFYLARVVNYFDWIDDLDLDRLPQYWVNQKQKLLDRLKSILLSK